MSLTFTQQKKPTASLIPARHRQQDHQTTFQPPRAEEAPPQPGFGHEFSQVDVHSGGRTGKQFASACPLALPSPRACPFGGACHTCPAPIQAKLTISQPGDKYEQEADRVADQVMAMPEPRNGQRLQRECSECDNEAQRQAELPKPEEEPEEEEEEASAKLLQRQDVPPKPEEEEEEEPEGTASPKLLQRQNAVEEEEEEEKTVTPKTQQGRTPQVTPSVTANINALRSGGRPLSDSSRVFFEPRFGHDFSRVRVHTDSRAADTAQAVQAKAFTLGRDIVFGAGQYAPDTRGGRRLMAHELAHVVQQNGDNVRGNLTIGQSNDIYKQEADRVAKEGLVHRQSHGYDRKMREGSLQGHPVQRQGAKEKEEEQVQGASLFPSITRPRISSLNKFTLQGLLYDPGATIRRREEGVRATVVSGAGQEGLFGGLLDEYEAWLKLECYDGKVVDASVGQHSFSILLELDISFSPIRKYTYRCSTGSTSSCRRVDVTVKTIALKLAQVETISFTLTACCCTCKGGDHSPGEICPSGVLVSDWIDDAPTSALQKIFGTGWEIRGGKDAVIFL